MEIYLATWELCSSNPAQCCSALCGKQDHIWEAGLLRKTEIGTTWYLAFYFGFLLNLVHCNALFFPEALGFDDAKTFLCCHIFSKDEHVFKMLGIKLGAFVLASLLLSHCYCFLFLRTWPSAPQWIRKNLSNPPSSPTVQFAVPCCSPDSSFSHPKHRSQQVTNDSWKVKHYQKLRETLSKRTFIYNSPSEAGKLCIPSLPKNAEKICSSNWHQKLHKSIHTLEYPHSDLQHLELSVQDGWWV